MPMKMPMAGAERRLADEDMPREMTKQAHDVRKDLAYACQSCRKMEFMLLEGKKLLECSKCRKMGRKVLYCSRCVDSRLLNRFYSPIPLKGMPGQRLEGRRAEAA